MLKTWMSCLCILGSTLTLIAQTEMITPNSPTRKSWMDGGATTEFTRSPPLAYPPIREADILWEKRVWRVIDTREKINLPFRHPEHALFKVLAAGLAAGKINAYSPEDDRFLAQISIEDIWQKLNRRDTVMVSNPITLETSPQVVVDTFDPNRIKRWRVQEVWYQDTRYSHMQVRIIGIAPLVETQVSDAGVDINFESPIFWINYSEARHWLAQYPVANSGNDHGQISWEDLFSMRRFHSYIYKESDMRGRRLEDSLSGTDLLLESKKKDRAIQNREMDMWSY